MWGILGDMKSLTIFSPIDFNKVCHSLQVWLNPYTCANQQSHKREVTEVQYVIMSPSEKHSRYTSVYKHFGQHFRATKYFPHTPSVLVTHLKNVCAYYHCVSNTLASTFTISLFLFATRFQWHWKIIFQTWHLYSTFVYFFFNPIVIAKTIQ